MKAFDFNRSGIPTSFQDDDKNDGYGSLKVVSFFSILQLYLFLILGYSNFSVGHWIIWQMLLNGNISQDFYGA